MNFLRVAWERLLATFRKRELDREFGEELKAHLDLLVEENERRGMSNEEARRAALIQLGGVEPARELQRDTRAVPFLDHLAQDLRYTFRTLRRDLGFATFAILIVGLGVGASSMIFSVVNTLLIRPLPFAQASKLVWIANDEGGPEHDMSGETVQVNHFLDLRDHNESFSDLAAYFAFYGTGDSKLTGHGEPERLTGVPVSENFFSLLGVQPEYGRLFNDAECKWNGPRVVLLSHGFWERHFASDPSIVGQSLGLDGRPSTVVGVLPASFDFGTVFAPGSRIDLFFPFPLTPETNRWGNTLAIVGRLKPGATMQSAQAEFTVLGQRIEKAHPERNHLIPKLTLLSGHVSGQLRPALLVLAAAVGVVMLIVCANLSNLLLARSASRQKEIAVRAALGAGKGRLIQQLLTESVVLSCCGATLGLVFAFAGTRALTRLTSVSIPLLDRVHMDITTLSVTILVAVMTGLLFGLVPALQVPAINLQDALKDSARGSSQGHSHAWMRNLLVVSEIAFACVLVVGAGLLIHSFLRVLDVNLGFQPERAATLRIDPDSSYSTQEQRNAYFTDALHRVLATPGITGAGLSDSLPLGHNRSWGAAAKGRVYTPENYPSGFVRIISNGYFQAMGIPFIEGRDFTEADTPSSLPAIIINETLAKNSWPGQDPLGQILITDKERTVVGVVSDVRHLALEQKSGNEFYLPIRQTQDYGSVDLVVRTALPPASLASTIREALRPIQANLPTNDFRTLQQIVDKAVSPRRFIVVLLAGFAAFALILASLGIYAVISYSVSQRTQEIGIRMALGASAGALQAGILRQTLSLAAIGMAAGVLCSWALGHTLSSLLFGVTPTDPTTFLGMAILLTVVAALAGYLPARRASRIDPMTALRVS
jgi:putative ABC transport system permease protein